MSATESSPEPMPLVLRVGDRKLPLDPGRAYVAGSGEAADLRIGHASVAPAHVRLELQGLRLRAQDLGSATGTWVDDVRVDAAEIPLGRTFRLGEIPIRFEQEVAFAAIAGSGVAMPLVERMREPRFAELMAEQLHRAPWFAVSLAAHAILLLVLSLFLESEPPKPGWNRVLRIHDAETTEPIDDLEEEAPAVEVERIEQDPVLQETRVEQRFDEPAAEAFDPGELDSDPLGDGMLARIRGGSGSEILDAVGRGGDAERFRSKISSLRKTGLDVVFVFDSTQSMHEVLDETKRNVALMLDVLQALVRGARVGIVTYRDHGPREEYLTREIPLDDDYYRAINFMQTVHPGGGHDYPEAVYDGLLAATRMRWRKDAERVIVLIGDAPAHANTERKLRSMLLRFVADGRGVVHAITTRRDEEGVDAECRASFEGIARAGKGTCSELGDQERILRDVMSLAIGQTFARSIDKVYDAVDAHRSRISASARTIVERGDLERITVAFTRRRIDDDLVKALVQCEDRRVARHLVELLMERGTPERARHAIAFVLMKLLGLTAPPVDPVEGGAMARERGRELERRIEGKLR